MKRAVACDSRQVGMTEHYLESGEAVVMAINYSACPVHTKLTTSGNWRVGGYHTSAHLQRDWNCTAPGPPA